MWIRVPRSAIAVLNKRTNVLQNSLQGQYTGFMRHRFSGHSILHDVTMSNSRYFSSCNCHCSYKFGCSTLPLLSSTLGNILNEAADKVGDSTAVIVSEENVRKTFSEFTNDVNKFATGLIALGLKKGDRVGMWGPNCYEWLLTQFATAKAGLIMVTINPAYRATEIEYSLNKIGCKTLIATSQFKTQDYYELLCEVSPDLRSVSSSVDLYLSRLPHLKNIVMINDKAKPGTITFRNVVEAADSGHFQELIRREKRVQFDDPINVQFTSGTTGKPKGATLSHFNVVNNAYFIGNRLGFHKQLPVICQQVPLYHCFGCVLGSICWVLFQGKIVLPAPSFQPGKTLKAIHSERCNVIYGTPTMYIDILNNPDLMKYDLSSLKVGVMSGSLCPEPLLYDAKTKLHLQDILIPYGCTETSPVCTLTSQSDPEVKKLQTVGKPLDYIEVKVVDENGELVPPNEKGEVCLRGHATFLGYWEDSAKTQEVLKPDKWYYTGDIGTMDEDGYLFIAGRKKDTIIRGGENIYPREIEEFLLTHSSIADVHVIGVPDKRFGEDICAWIQLVEGHSLTEKDIKDFCKNKISHFKIPRHILFVEDFPMTVTGKVQKFQMKEDSIKLLNL